MKSKYNWIFIGILTLFVQVGFAQSKTLTGIVTEEGFPMPGVSVILSGTIEGTQTDLDGKYSINVKEGDTVVFSFIGYKDVKHLVGASSVFNVALQADENELAEVVVTALGIKRDKRKLGYASQEVKGDELAGAGQQNALSALSGNVAGLQVTAPSALGGSSRVILRGVKSVSGSNSPLIVIDGVPLDNSNFNDSNTQTGRGGRDFGDSSSDINPDDIESVTVLKGGTASALYGNRGGNGVILYTTKSAKNGRTEVEVNTGLSFESVNIMPKLQRQYGGGAAGASSFSTQIIDGKSYNIIDYGMDESWGSKYEGQMYLPWNAFDKEFADDYLKEIEWKAPNSDVKDFFDTGVTSSISAAVSKSFKESNIRMSFANNVTEGIVPNSKLQRNNLTLNASTMLTDKFKAEGNFNYVYTKGFNRPTQGYDGNSVAQKFFQWGQRQLDFDALKAYKKADGSQRSWNRTAWNNGTPAFSDNPYWTVHENTSDDVRVRTFGNVKLTYNFTDNLYAVGAVYADTYTYTIQNRVAVGSSSQSSYDQIKRTVSEYNYEARLHFDDHFGDFGVNAFVGTNRRESKRGYVFGATVGGLNLAGFYNLANSKQTPRASNQLVHQRTNSIFGSATVNWKEMLFLEGTLRTDWYSTVNKSSTYPSVTGTWIFSQILPELDWLSFGKIRAGWAQVGNDTAPYRTLNYYSVGAPFQDEAMFAIDNVLGNPDLKPELMTTKEIGLEAAFLKNRISFETTYYQIKTTDLITEVRYDNSTGFGSEWKNAGSMVNKGFEATVNIAPVRTEDFEWNISWNFSKNKNELLSLAEGVSAVTIATAPFKVGLEARLGEAYGQIYGTDFVYDDNGNKVINAQGLYEVSEIKGLGSYLPDYNMGIRNAFKYKNWSAGFLIDIQQGGHYFSTSHMWGMSSGMIEESAANGIRETGLVLDGVVRQADGSYVKNTQVTDAADWAKEFYSGVDAQNVFSSDYIKLREVTLSYDLPKTWIGPFSGITISAYGRNLFTWGLDWDGMDPEMASYGSGNIQAIEGGSLPSTRTYGMNVKFKF